MKNLELWGKLFLLLCVMIAFIALISLMGTIGFFIITGAIVYIIITTDNDNPPNDPNLKR